MRMSCTVRQPEPSVKAPWTMTMFLTPAGASGPAAEASIGAVSAMAAARVDRIRIACLRRPCGPKVAIWLTKSWRRLGDLIGRLNQLRDGGTINVTHRLPGAADGRAT